MSSKPIPVGPPLDHLPATAPVHTIAPAAEMHRTPFVFATPLALAHAQHGWTLTGPGFRTYHSPAITLRRLANTTLLGTDGVVLHDNQAIPDTLQHIMTWAPGSLVDSYQPGAQLHLRRTPRPAPPIPGDTFLGFSPAWRNYAHWLQECLPKLLGYIVLRAQCPGLRLLMPALLPGSFQAQTLALLGIEPASIVTVADGIVLPLEHAWLSTAADIWTVSPLLRRAARHLARCPAIGPAQTAERVYLRRDPGTRTLANFEALRPILDAAGFVVAAPGSLSLAEQITLMQGASYVIGEHGAALANIMFCRPGTTVIELFNPACPQPAHWSVATACGLRYGYAAGQGAPGLGWNDDYVIPPTLLQEVIATMTQPDKALRFTSPHEFEIAGHLLAVATPDPPPPGRTLIYKDRPFVEAYASLLPPLAPKTIFEFGIYQGGSAIFLTALLAPERFVCIDISDPIPSFTATLAANGLGTRIHPHFNTSQDDADRIRDILETEFGEAGPDLIIDDASHLYEPTRQSFQIAFPYLRPGGCYIIEDWSWAHWPENQSPTHGWHDRPAMSNLILELVLLLPSSDLIASIDIRQGFVMIHKQAARHRHPMLNIADTLRLRGRPKPS